VTISTALRDATRSVSETDRSIAAAVDAGVAMQTVDDVEYAGQYLEIHGVRLLNFGGCSYLGLAQHAELKAGAIDAVERFGTQFSFSRVYLESPLYPLVEGALGEMTGGHVLVTPTTTLGHIAALPVLIQPGDAVLIDRFAHASLHTAAALLRSSDVQIARHSRVDLLDEAIGQLVATHPHVWYLCDGLYSMRGDFAPIAALERLRTKYPQLRLYIDDAHSTSWYGLHGRGYALDSIRDRTNVVVALSLNKAFSAGGGALVFPTDEDKMNVRRCGGPLLFSGPVQPALLGAALASARLHLAPSFATLQAQLFERIDRAHSLARTLGLRFASQDRSPIFFLHCGPESASFALAKAMHDQGFYVCVSVFPAVPHNQSGLRFTVSLHNTLADIDRLVPAMAKEVRRLGIASALAVPEPNGEGGHTGHDEASHARDERSAQDDSVARRGVGAG
jgi:7-keto-8-aminopelargonate synthetase-like enzyme